MFERTDPRRRLLAAPILLLITLAAGRAAAADAPVGGGSIADLGLEDLMRVEVTTVSRRPQRIADTAAAVSVLTAEDIRRSGATSIPEALRLIPGVEVARIDGTRWAVSIRGFNVGFANKLLVLVDGRSVYSPLFSGTFWDGPDTFLEDIDRVEVIRGPGAVVWGSNAVNGVVNIITKRAADTTGGLVSATADPEERRVGGRYRIHGHDNSGNPFVSSTHPSGREDWLNVLAQDEIALVAERLRVMLGLKLERSSLVSGMNPQPDARLLWNISARHSVWIAASRANRLPSIAGKYARFNANFTPPALPFSPLPVTTTMGGSAGLGPEKLDSLQTGMRDQEMARLAFDATVFLHQYKSLALAGDAPVCAPVGGPPTDIGCVSQYNGLGTAQTHSFELSTDWRATDFTRLVVSYPYFEMNLHHPVDFGSVSERTECRSPRHGIRLNAQTDISERWSPDAVMRYVNESRPIPPVDPYWTADLRLGWQPRKDFELSLIARSIFDPRRLEFNSDPFFGAAEQRRAVLARAVWSC